MKYVLDNTKAIKLQTSNDAFFYLMYGEEPLDEDNLDEAREIEAMFQFGYSINDWEYVEDEPDLIEATFIPYVKVDIEYDGEMDFVAKNWTFKYKHINDKAVSVCISNDSTSQVYLSCNCNIIYINNKPWVIFNRNGDASMLSDYSNCTYIPLWKCKK